MALNVRLLAAADDEQSRQLGRESFGGSPSPEPAPLESPGKHRFGVFDDDRLVAQATDREYESWFGGVTITTSGIASVGVSPEYRGRGLVRTLLGEVFRAAVARGAVVSTLFPTAPRIYRGLGYERITDLQQDVHVPTAALASVEAPNATTCRRATAADMVAIRAIYDNWASAQNGPLTRRGVSFPTTDAEAIQSFSGITIAVDGDGAITGYASWQRGEGYDESAVMEVMDLLATSADAYRALLRMLASFSAVTPTTSIRSSGDDVVRMLLPTSHWKVISPDPYMLHVLDVTGALTARGYPVGVDAELAFSVAEVGYVLTVRDGVATCQRADGSAARVLTPQGLAATYAGSQSSANLRFIGQLRGGDVAEDALWDALFGGRQVHIRDYF